MLKRLLELVTVEETVGAILLFLAVLIIASIRWGNLTFSVKTLNQMIFHAKVPMDGTDDGIYADWFIHTVPGSLVITFAIGWTLFHLPIEGLNLYLHENLITIGIFAVVLALFYAIYNYQIISYVFDVVKKSDLYEKYYVDPRYVNITFPDKKRNLIHLYLESVETSYMSKESGGAQKESYMPELEVLANDNINFSHQDKLGGSYTLEGTQWTIASIVAQESGIPLLLPITAKSYDNDSSFLSGVYTIGEVLEKNGYVNEVIMGSDSNFACTSNFYKQHGNYIISDYNTAIKEKRISSDYFVFWGYEDQKLFKFAKEDITKLAAGDKPFNFVIETIDTHTPDGYVCDCCEHKYDNQYANVIACQSKQVNEFINWCKKQSWYENTTIVITGDHNSMSEKFFKHLDHDYIRTPYNCIINSPISSEYCKNRKFSVIDLYPTMLAALGAKIDGDQLGLGVNLFSGKKTLIERFGFKKINQEVKKRSELYRCYLAGEQKDVIKKRKWHERQKNYKRDT